MTMVDVSYWRRPRMTAGSCWPISRKTKPSRRKSTSRHTALVWRRAAPDPNSGVWWPTIRPATTTASTPETCSASPSRYATNGVASEIAFDSSGSAVSGRTSRFARATTTPTAIPPAAASTNCPIAAWNENSPPTAAATATLSMVSAVASFSSPSPWMIVTIFGGRLTRRPTARAATGSGGATAAPTAMPAASVAPATNRWNPTPTSSPVRSTSTTERLTTIRRLRRMSSRDESSAAL